jgi:chitinase
MKKFLIEYWYRYANDQKDFEQEWVIAETPEEATEKIKRKSTNIFKTTILQTINLNP